MAQEDLDLSYDKSNKKPTRKSQAAEEGHQDGRVPVSERCQSGTRCDTTCHDVPGDDLLQVYLQAKNRKGVMSRSKYKRWLLKQRTPGGRRVRTEKWLHCRRSGRTNTPSRSSVRH